MHFCSKEKETGAILFLEVRNWPYIDLRRRKLVLYCFQEKRTGALSTDLEKKLVQHCSQGRELVRYCYQEKETGALLFLGEGNWCSTVFRRR